MTEVIPFVRAGDYDFGMTVAEVQARLSRNDVWYDYRYKDARLVALTCNIDDVDTLVISGTNVSELNHLDAALYIASLSKRPGQAQGGSLYFDDLGVAILQFESAIREFVFYAKDYDHGEPLRPMTSESICAYYEEQTS